ncbi:hypothetical protein G7062_06435 [Erysipelothrix sp. HDW6C]|uniref:hypothetical protein n=1 Tax=Erysipelothrix sp. HDW6C TaxID=2714930 RepID=UPI001408BFF2|nr:hypothetical protein [Erysipelothrix sp. HDW6C]QIK69945.1 hypothetical protein G7062_06435 [Erysipelothrix sp. HDW6C]
MKLKIIPYAVLNVLGFGMIAYALYLGLSNQVVYALILGTAGLLSSGLSIHLMLKLLIAADTTTNTLATDVLSEDEMTETIEDIIDQEPEIDDDVVSDDAFEDTSNQSVSTVVEPECIYQFDIINLSRFQSEVLELAKVMNAYDLIQENPVYDHRLEVLLKSGHIDKKIWRYQYGDLPFVTIRVNNTADGLDIHAGVKQTEHFHIGSVPSDNVNFINQLLREDIHVKAYFTNGSYRYISSLDHSFVTSKEPISLHVSLYK